MAVVLYIPADSGRNLKEIAMIQNANESGFQSQDENEFDETSKATDGPIRSGDEQDDEDNLDDTSLPDEDLDDETEDDLLDDSEDDDLIDDEEEGDDALADDDDELPDGNGLTRRDNAEDEVI